MTTLLALLALLADVVHTKDNKKLEGRVYDFCGFVEVVQADGKRVRVDRSQIARIEREARLLAFPDHRSFPHDVLKDVTFDYVTQYNVLVATPKPPQDKAYAVDADTGRQLWELPCKLAPMKPVFYGTWVIVVTKEKTVDEKQRYKWQGANYAKDVETLTFTGFDLVTHQQAWQFKLDNNDRGDVLYGFQDANLAIHGLRNHILLRVGKSGHPMDRTGTIDRNVTQVWTDFYFWSPEKQKLERNFRSDEVHKGTTLLVNDEHFVYYTVPRKDNFRVTSLGLRDGKNRWQTEEFLAQPVAVTDDRVIVRDEEKMWAYWLKNGKKDEKWGISHTGSYYVAYDEDNLYVFRTTRAPRAIVAFDWKKGQQQFAVPMPDADKFEFRFLSGSLLVYTNMKYEIFAFDVVKRAPAWSWTPSGNGYPKNFMAVGGAIVLYKDGRVTAIEITTGRHAWSVPAMEYLHIQEAGDRGVICFKRSGTDLVRERVVPAKSIFLSDVKSPLRYTQNVDLLSAPAFADGLVWTVSNRGQLLGVNLETRTIAVEIPIGSTGTTLPFGPAARGSTVVATWGGKAFLFDGKTREKKGEWNTRPTRGPFPFEWAGDKLFIPEGAGLMLLDPAAGKEAWRGECGYVSDVRVVGSGVYVLEGSHLHELELGTGRKVRTLKVPDATTFIGAGKGAVYAARQGYRLACLKDDGDEQWAIQSDNQDPKVATTFRGHLEFGDGTAYWANADGRLLCVNLADGRTAWTYAIKDFCGRIVQRAGKLFFTAPGLGLVTLDAKTGQELARENVPDVERFIPFVLGDKGCFWSTDGWMIPGE